MTSVDEDETMGTKQKNLSWHLGIYDLADLIFNDMFARSIKVFPTEANLCENLKVWLTDWMTDWLTDQLTEWLTGVGARDGSYKIRRMQVLEWCPQNGLFWLTNDQQKVDQLTGQNVTFDII